jgi:predicted MPP superfamily phosphohydrolase
MSFDLLLLAPILLGHLVLFVLTVNVVHAFGFHERVMTWAKLGILGTFAFLALWIGWTAWSEPVVRWSWPALLYGLICVMSGVVVFPVTTWFLHTRKRPAGITERWTETDLGKTVGEESLIGSGRGRWLLSLPGNESFRLRKVEWEIMLPGLPQEFDGLTLLQLSDLHFAPCFQRRFFELVAEEVAGWDSDLVLFTGDLIDHDSTREWIVPVLSRLAGRLGTFAILGNHDVEHDPLALLSTLGEAGFTDLEGKWATISHNGNRIALAGTSSPWGERPSLADCPQADYKLLLSHAPDLYYWAERAGFDFMLSGHNHGGQIRLPLIGPVFMPSRYSRRFDRGFFRRNGLTLHVSQGVAGKHPVRYGCVPEIARLVLRSGKVVSNNFTTHSGRHADVRVS